MPINPTSRPALLPIPGQNVVRPMFKSLGIAASGIAAQRQRMEVIAQNIAAPFDPELWFADRIARQQIVLQTLRRLQRERASPAQAQAALRALAEQVQHSPNPAMREAQEKLKRYGCEFAARFHNAATPKQRRFAVERLKGWEEDVRALAAQPRPASGPPPT